MTNTAKRDASLRNLLLTRRYELQTDVNRRILDRKSDQQTDVRDPLDRSDVDVSVDVEFSLIEMKLETLSRIAAALGRLKDGEYGHCVGCDAEISETRLRALPFAVRCTACEERREDGQAVARRLTTQSGFSRFTEAIGS